MLKSIIISAVILFATIATINPVAATSKKQVSSINSIANKHCTNMLIVNEQVHRHMYFMYGDKRFTYWLDVEAPPEANVKTVDDRSISRWQISKKELKSGEQFIGIFDKSGRILLKIKKG